MAGSVEGCLGVVGGEASADDAGALEADVEAACGNDGVGRRSERGEGRRRARGVKTRRVGRSCYARVRVGDRQPQIAGGEGRGSEGDEPAAATKARGCSRRRPCPASGALPRARGVYQAGRSNGRVSILMAVLLANRRRFDRERRHTRVSRPDAPRTHRVSEADVFVFVESRARAHGPSSARDRRGLDRAMSPALPRADLDALMSVVSRLREVAARLRDASSSDADVQSIATEASLLFLDLKAANREVLESAEETREATAAAKAALDGARLRLQNVLYEKAHIQKEIRANQDFRSAFTDEEIGLCSVDEFRRKAPEETRKGLDEHELMLKRLSHELTERKALCERERALEVRKASGLKRA